MWAAMNLGSTAASWSDDYCNEVLEWDSTSTSYGSLLPPSSLFVTPLVPLFVGSQSWCEGVAATSTTDGKVVTHQGG